MFELKKLAEALLLPPMGIAFLGIVGLVLLRRHPRVAHSLLVLSLGSLVLLSLPPIADLLLGSLSCPRAISAQQLSRAQAIVVLGGGTYYGAPEYGGDTVGGYSLERVRYGAYLQARTGLPILVSGGAPFGGASEAELMRKVIETEFHGHVGWEENASRDTAENARFSAVILKQAGISRIALVSHAWHLPRAVSEFRAQGIEVYAAPTELPTREPPSFSYFLPAMSALYGSTIVIHEWAGLLVQGPRSGP